MNCLSLNIHFADIYSVIICLNCHIVVCLAIKELDTFLEHSTVWKKASVTYMLRCPIE